MSDNRIILKNSTGLVIEFLDNGAIKSIEAGPIRINLNEGTPHSIPGSNLFLRKRSGPISFTALLGPESDSQFYATKNALYVDGSWEGLDYECILRLSPDDYAWQWQITIINTTGNPEELDLVYLQDVGMKALNAGLINEYYVAQYLERRILEDDAYGRVVCCRQNMKESTGHPWLMTACKNGAAAASTDGILFYGNTYRGTGIPESLLSGALGGEYSGESPIVALQERPFRLNGGEGHSSIFAALYLPDHSEATSENDLKKLTGLFEEFPSGTPSLGEGWSPCRKLFK